VQVAEDLSYVVMLRRKFGYLESIPGVLLPHPSTAGVFPGGGGCVGPPPVDIASAGWPPGLMPPPAGPPLELYDPYGAAVAAAGPAAAAAAASMHIMPSMSSLEALLSKLPSVVPAPQAQPPAGGAVPGAAPLDNKEEEEEEEQDDYVQCHGMGVASNGGESTSTSAATAAGAATAPIPPYFVDVGGSSNPGEGF